MSVVAHALDKIRGITDLTDAFAPAYELECKQRFPVFGFLIASMFTAYTGIAIVTHGTEHILNYLVTFVLPAALIAALALWCRRSTSTRSAPWLAALGDTIAFSGPLASALETNHVADTAFALLVFVCVGITVFRALPFWVVTATFLAVYCATVTSLGISDESTADAIVAGVVAVCVAFAVFAMQRAAIRRTTTSAKELTYRASHDALTGLLNRHALESAGQSLIAFARRSGSNVFAAFVDIDGLGEINNQYGHGAGDEAITTVAHALTNSVREADIVSRWGGDEIVLVGIGDGPDVHRIEEAVRDFAVRNSAVPGWDGQVSAGVVALPSVGTSFEGLILTADAEMYERRGRRRSGAA